MLRCKDGSVPFLCLYESAHFSCIFFNYSKLIKAINQNTKRFLHPFIYFYIALATIAYLMRASLYIHVYISLKLDTKIMFFCIFHIFWDTQLLRYVFPLCLLDLSSDYLHNKVTTVCNQSKDIL